MEIILFSLFLIKFNADRTLSIKENVYSKYSRHKLHTEAGANLLCNQICARYSTYLGIFFKRTEFKQERKVIKFNLKIK